MKSLAIHKRMKQVIRIGLSALLLTTTSLRADGDCLEAAVEEMNDLYRTGEGCEDGIFNSVSSWMIGWGIGLFVGIALLTGLIHSHSSSDSSTVTNSSSSLN